MKYLNTLLLLIPAALFVGCGKSNQAQVSLTNANFSTTPVRALSSSPGLNPTLSTQAAALAVTEFKFCVKSIKLEDEDGNDHSEDGSVKKDDDGNEAEDIKFHPGLIDIGAGQSVDWGKITIPVNFKLAKLKMKIHRDDQLCGVPYSLDFNGQTTSEDLEFHWKFNPPVDLSSNSTVLKLSFDSVIITLKNDIAAGGLASLKNDLDAIEDQAEEEHK